MKQDLRETIGLVLVAASMVFVGFQIQQSNVQARAAAYQQLGIAVSEYHQNISPLEEALELEAGSDELLRAWTLDDWSAYSRLRLSSLRLAETLQTQVEQGLLPPGAVEALGYGGIIGDWLRVPAQVCLWPQMASWVSVSVRSRVEALPQADRAECPIGSVPDPRSLDRSATPRPPAG